MVKDRVRRLRRGAILLLLVLTALLTVPFLLTTQLVRLALGRVFPANNPGVGSAVLSLSGALVVHDLTLHDTGAAARQPLITIGEIEATFGWAELLARRVRRVRAGGVTVYVRPESPAPLSPLALLPRRAQPGPPAAPARGSLPLWIDTFALQGTVRVEPARGSVAANADLPLALHMTTSGDLGDSARQFLVTIGDVRQLPEKPPEKPAAAAAGTAPTPGAAFALRAEVATLSAADGTRVVVHRLAARQ